MSDEVQRVEGITSVQRRRRWSVAEKIRPVEETLEPGMSVSFGARKARHLAKPAVQVEAADGRGRPGSGPGQRRGDRRRPGAPARGAYQELGRLLGRKTIAVE